MAFVMPNDEDAHFSFIYYLISKVIWGALQICTAELGARGEWMKMIRIIGKSFDSLIQHATTVF